MPTSKNEKLSYQKLIFTIFLLTIIDMLCTMFEVEYGYAYEINPFMIWIWAVGESLLGEGQGFIAFGIIKTYISASCCAIFFYTVDRLLTRIAVIVIFLVYLFLFFWHIAGIVNHIYS